MTDEYDWLPGHVDCRIRRKEDAIQGVLWHWTAGEGDPESVVRVLRQRGLSIHYVIGYDGTLRRCADPATTITFHGGSVANPRFIGVEIASKGLAPASPKRPRREVQASAHGHKLRAVDFTEAQYATIGALADELSDRFAIPRKVAQGDGVMLGADLRRFHGHLEHLHVSPKKIDAGTLVMDFLDCRWGCSMARTP